MLIINNYFNQKNFKKNYQTTPLKQIFFTNKNLSKDNFVKNNNDQLLLNQQKKLLKEKISKNLIFQQNQNLKNNANTIIDYSKTSEQLNLAELVFDNEFFHTETNLCKMKGIIGAANNKIKSDFVKLILNNKFFYENDNIINKLEPVLYTFNNNPISYQPKFEVLNNILASENLYKNKEFMNSVGSILYETDDFNSSYKTVNVLNSILEHENFSDDKNFMHVLGKIFALTDVARYTNPQLPKILENLNDNQYQRNIINSITFLLNKEGTDVFTKTMKNKKLSNDENFIKFLPDIIYCINKKNYTKADAIIACINKNKTTKSEEFNKKMIYEYMYGNYKPVKKAEQLVKLKYQAYEKIYQLQSANKTLTIKDIDSFFDENIDYILPATDILGEKIFVHAYRLKLHGLKELCRNCSTIKENISEEYFEKLLLKINPKASQTYQNLQQEIFNLKKNYQTVKNSKDPLKIKNLQNSIDTLTKKSQELLSNKLNYDPDTVINKINILANSDNNSNNSNDTKILYHTIIDLMQNPAQNEDEQWQKLVYDRVFLKLGIPYDNEFINRINLDNNKYIGKILSGNTDLIKGLNEIFNLIRNNPDKSISEIFNELPSNKITKTEFEKHGIDYDKWVNFDKNSYQTVKTYSQKNGDIVIRKVDMNNIGKAIFLGNEAGCCTAIGSSRFQSSAPFYIKHKFTSAIEILDNNNPVGNTMCYFANVENELALILDNIQLKSGYKNDNNIKENIITYSKKLCAEVGKPNIPVYVVGHRNSIDLSDYKTFDCICKIIGDSGDDYVYLDSKTDFTKIDPNKNFLFELTKVA